MTSVAVDLQAEQALELVALDRPQMEAAHQQMIAWVRTTSDTVKRERDEELAALAIAKERKWATAPYDRHIKLADRRLTFYEKLEAALLAGYVIVPNFAMTVFAVRTKRTTPRGAYVEREHSWRTDHVQAPDLSPAGVGEYQNPHPVVMQRTNQIPDGKGGTKNLTVEWPEEFRDIAFPVALAKPVLMSKTAEVMAQRLFDELGVAVNSARGSNRGDPILLGRLRNPARNRSDVTFFLGWYLNVARI